jgi:DNA-binding MarR family transcriptional regulator
MKGEKVGQFVSAMFDMIKAIKKESEFCREICGGVSEKELFIIVFVGQGKSVKMSEIAEDLNTPLSTLTSIVDKLVSNKFLMRYNSEEDRRVVKVALAERGADCYKLFMKQKHIIAERVLMQFQDQDQDMLLIYLQKLATSMSIKNRK